MFLFPLGSQHEFMLNIQSASFSVPFSFSIFLVLFIYDYIMFNRTCYTAFFMYLLWRNDVELKAI